MNDPKAFEGGMASSGGYKGILSDPLSLATKPPVIFKFASALLSLIVYSCVSSAWYDGRCLFNKYNGICRFGSMAYISFIACIALLVLEVMFNHISSIKVRRRIAIGDVIISAINTIFYVLLFVFLSIAWLKSDYPAFGLGINCCRFAILLSFCAIFALAACTGLAYVRYQSGVDMSQFMTEDQLAQEQAQYYQDSNGINYQANGSQMMSQQQIDDSNMMGTNYAMDANYSSYGYANNPNMNQ